MRPLLVYSCDSLALSQTKILFTSKKLLGRSSSFIYNHNNNCLPSLSTPNHNNKLPYSILLPPNSPNTFSSNTIRNKPFSSSAQKMATCIDTSRAAEATKNNIDPKNYAKSFCRSNYSICQTNQKSINGDHHQYDHDEDDLWVKMVQEAKNDVEQEPILSNYYYNSIVSHKCLENALANHLATKLSSLTLNSNTLFDLFRDCLIHDKEIMSSVKDDLRAVRERDPACISYVHCFLNFKGFLACQSHRIAHKLWCQGRKILALMIQNRVSEVFAVDIHPGAKIGKGILLDHATGLVVGETAVIGNNVSILHNVTLGGTGKACGDRHPKIGDGVLIGAGTCVLGNVKIGDGAKIGAGSVVIKEVPPRTTAVGNPARLLGGKDNPVMLDKIPSFTMDHTSHIQEWSDYVI